MSPTVIVAYLALFATVGFLFVFASLLLGKFLRAHAPSAQKLESYECGEPAVGPGSVQFDLRFYVVALLFLIFEVEVVFFFPPATVFGQATRLLAWDRAVRCDVGRQADGAAIEASNRPAVGVVKCSESSARSLALASLIDMGVFFAVLLVGFAFLWRRGDLDWVRATRHPTTPGETAALAARLYRSDYRP